MTTEGNDLPRTREAGFDVSKRGLTSSDQPVQTALWVRHLPEAFGIRAAVAASKYRWCARESAMWGIATGTAMTLHRLRMRSRFWLAINVGFATTFVVYSGTYYFCVQKRDFNEKAIAKMMQLNSMEPMQDLPKDRIVDETHPFARPAAESDRVAIPEKQYVIAMPGRKEWQPQVPTQDAADAFTPSKPPDNRK